MSIFQRYDEIHKDICGYYTIFHFHAQRIIEEFHYFYHTQISLHCFLDRTSFRKSSIEPRSNWVLYSVRFRLNWNQTWKHTLASFKWRHHAQLPLLNQARSLEGLWWNGNSSFNVSQLNCKLFIFYFISSQIWNGKNPNIKQYSCTYIKSKIQFNSIKSQ